MLHSGEGHRLNVEVLAELGEDQVHVFVGRVALLASLPQNDGLLEKNEESLIFVDAKLPDLVKCSLFPEIGDGVNLIGENVANNGGVDVGLGLEELVSEPLGNLLKLRIILVCNDIGKSFLPVARLWLLLHVQVELWAGDRVNNRIEIILDNSLDNVLDVLILLLSEEAGLDLFVEFLAAGLSNKKRLSRPTTLKSNFSSVLELTDQQILLDDTLWSLVPIDISGDGLLDCVKSGILSSLVVSAVSGGC